MQRLHGFLHGIKWIKDLGHLENHFSETGLTQNRKTIALRTLTTVDLFYYIMCENMHTLTFTEIAFRWEPGHIWNHPTLEGSWPPYMNEFGGVLGTAFGHFLLGSHDFMVTTLLARMRSSPFTPKQVKSGALWRKNSKGKEKRRLWRWRKRGISQGARWHHARENPSICCPLPPCSHCCIIYNLYGHLPPKWLILFRENREVAIKLLWLIHS